MGAKARPTLQDIHRRRQDQAFVGRAQELGLFRENLTLQPSDPGYAFVVSISGQGGMGKTWLLRQFEEQAKEAGFATAWADENDPDALAVLATLAGHLNSRGTMQAFLDRHGVYKRRLGEVRSDPDAPKGLPAFVGHSVGRAAVLLGRRVPLAGAPLDFVDPDAAADQMSEWAAFIARKISNRDEVELLQNPIEVLGPLFVQGINDLADLSDIALLIDTYERVGTYIESLLLALLDGRLGSLPSNFLLLIAGRDDLDPNVWSPYEDLVLRIHLDAFGESEARAYLERKGVADKTVVETILQLSGRMPLLLAMLASEQPDSPEEIGDPTGTAVERFLKWIEDPERRRLAVDAALPRQFNIDVLGALGEAAPQEAFAWLRERPFVHPSSRGLVYHAVVREQMLRQKRIDSPEDWEGLHLRLADFFAERRDSLGLKGREAGRDPNWQLFELEVTYHKLCGQLVPDVDWLGQGFIQSFDFDPLYAQRWVDTVEQAAQDSDSADLRKRAASLLKLMDAYEDERYEDVAGEFTALVDGPNAIVPTTWRHVALYWRGRLYAQLRLHRRALDDLSEAVELKPEVSSYYGYRGMVRTDLGEYDAALEDFANAAGKAQTPRGRARWLGKRAEAFAALDSIPDALSTASLAVEADPSSGRALITQGEMRRIAGDPEGANLGLS
jgi:hypothetical protein